MLPKTFQLANSIIEKINQHDEVAYIVGGAIRNYLLKMPMNDIDIATSASPTKLARIFPHVIDIAVDHETVLVIEEGIPFEITSFRGDEQTLADDLSYRDFTMNALAIGQDGMIIDYFNGQTHIKEQKIVAVGNARDRILADPLRIVRALRFISELNFTLDDELYIAMKTEKIHLQEVATERLLQEWTKLIKGFYFEKAVKLIESLHIDAYLPIMRSDATLMKELTNIDKPFLNFASFISYMYMKQPTISLQQWTKAWKSSNESKKNAQQLVQFIQYYEKKGVDDFLIYSIPDQLVLSFADVWKKIYKEKLDMVMWQQRKQKLPIQSRLELTITGHDIIELFPYKKRGKWISDMLDNIEKMVIFRQLLNDKNEIKEWIQCHPPVND